jgi:nitrogen regulatory protein P-II 1
VKDALKRIGIVGMNVVEVRGHGRQGGVVLEGRVVLSGRSASAYVQHRSERSQCRENDSNDLEAAGTGAPGDGIIFVYPVEDVIRIRTGERGRKRSSTPNDIDTRTDGGNGNEMTPVVPVQMPQSA